MQSSLSPSSFPSRLVESSLLLLLHTNSAGLPRLLSPSCIPLRDTPSEPSRARESYGIGFEWERMQAGDEGRRFCGLGGPGGAGEEKRKRNLFVFPYELFCIMCTCTVCYVFCIGSGVWGVFVERVVMSFGFWVLSCLVSFLHWVRVGCIGGVYCGFYGVLWGFYRVDREGRVQSIVYRVRMSDDRAGSCGTGQPHSAKLYRASWSLTDMLVSSSLPPSPSPSPSAPLAPSLTSFPSPPPFSPSATPSPPAFAGASLADSSPSPSPTRIPSPTGVSSKSLRAPIDRPIDDRRDRAGRAPALRLKVSSK